MLLLLLFFITINCLTPFNKTQFFELTDKKDFFDINQRFILYKFTPNQFRCISGDACDYKIKELYCNARPFHSLYELRCSYHGKGLLMENLEVQCGKIHYNPKTPFFARVQPRQCIATYNLYKTENYSYILNTFSNYLPTEKLVKGVMMSIDYAYQKGHFDTVIWDEMTEMFRNSIEYDNMLLRKLI